MNKSDFTIGNRLREAAIEAGIIAGSNTGCHCGVTIAEASQAAALIESQAAEIERLQAYNKHCGELDDEIVKKYTCIADQAVEIERLKQEVVSEKAGLAGERLGTIAALRRQLEDSDAELTRLRGWQQTALPWLPKCGTGCQCQGEHDCELKVLRRQAAAATKRRA